MTRYDPEMTIFKECTYASTPDIEINCICQGAGLVEINCRATRFGKIPRIENYNKQTEKDGDKLKLKFTSLNYSQIQGKFALTGRLYCDLSVFSLPENLKICVKYSDLYWKILLSGLRLFWRNVIADELLTKKLKHKTEKIYDEDSLVAINRHKTGIALQENYLNLAI